MSLHIDKQRGIVHYFYRGFEKLIGSGENDESEATNGFSQSSLNSGSKETILSFSFCCFMIFNCIYEIFKLFNPTTEETNSWFSAFTTINAGLTLFSCFQSVMCSRKDKFYRFQATWTWYILTLFSLAGARNKKK